MPWQDTFTVIGAAVGRCKEQLVCLGLFLGGVAFCAVLDETGFFVHMAVLSVVLIAFVLLHDTVSFFIFSKLKGYGVTLKGSKFLVMLVSVPEALVLPCGLLRLAFNLFAVVSLVEYVISAVPRGTAPTTAIFLVFFLSFALAFPLGEFLDHKVFRDPIFGEEGIVPLRLPLLIGSLLLLVPLGFFFVLQILTRRRQGTETLKRKGASLPMRTQPSGHSSLPREPFQVWKLLRDACRAVACGLFMAVVVTLLVFIFAVWAMMSINYFWMYTTEMSKHAILSRLNGDTLDAMRVDNGEVSKLRKWPLDRFPAVIKPNVCTTSSRGVSLCADMKCLENYILNNRREGASWLIQRFHPGIEGVVFFYKYPYSSKGYVKNVGVRKEAYREYRVIGKHLEARYFANYSRSEELNTPELQAAINYLTKDFVGYHGGRFDVFFDTLEDAKQGKGIHIIEGNIFPLEDIAEKRNTVVSLIQSVRTLLMQLWSGTAVILGGYNSNPATFVTNIPRLVERYYLCGKNGEHVLAKP